MNPTSLSAQSLPSSWSPGDDDNYEGGFGQCDGVDDDINDDIGDDVNDDVHDTDDNGDVPHLLHVRPLSSAPLALDGVRYLSPSFF